MVFGSRTKRFIRRFLRSRSGNIAIISTLMMPVIVGFCALAAESSYWYYRHKNIQDAADIAAYGGAVVLARGGNDAEVAAAAKADAITNGWRANSGTITVEQYGPFVEVLLVENQQRSFSQVFCADSTVAIKARAVAAVHGPYRVSLVFTKEPANSRQIEPTCVTVPLKAEARIPGRN